MCMQFVMTHVFAATSALEVPTLSASTLLEFTTGLSPCAVLAPNGILGTEVLHIEALLTHIHTPLLHDVDFTLLN
jgi:hypothetical protein